MLTLCCCSTHDVDTSRLSDVSSPSVGGDSTDAKPYVVTTDQNHNIAVMATSSAPAVATATPRSHNRHSGCGHKDATGSGGAAPKTPTTERRTSAARRSVTEAAKALNINASAPERKNFVRTGSMRDKRSKY